MDYIHLAISFPLVGDWKPRVPASYGRCGCWQLRGGRRTGGAPWGGRTSEASWEVLHASSVPVSSCGASELLDSESDGIEVSYNAAGILAHILSDGAACWEGIRAVFREGVLVRMRQAIDRWPLATKRNINYRSVAVFQQEWLAKKLPVAAKPKVGPTIC